MPDRARGRRTAATLKSRVDRAAARARLDAAAGRAMAGACRVGRCSADRVGAAVARAGIHARHLRIGDTDRASTRRAPRSGPARARSRAHRAIRRAREPSRRAFSRRTRTSPRFASASRRAVSCASCSTSSPRSGRRCSRCKPVAEFGHRLVIDLYPRDAVDPLMALLERERADTPAPAAGGDSAARRSAIRTSAARFAQDTVATHHRRDRSRPRRRGSRRRRPPRHAREGRRARDRAQAQDRIDAIPTCARC